MARIRTLALLAVPLLGLPLLVPRSPADAAAARPAGAGFAVRFIPDYSYPVSPANIVERWNPCAPIRYAVNLAGAPKGALAEVQRAAADAQKASGITFTYVGTTSATSHAVPAPGGGLQLDAKPLAARHLDLVVEWEAKGIPHSLLALVSADPAGAGLTIAGGSWSQTGNVLTRHPTRITAGVIALDRAQGSALSAASRDAHGNGLHELLLHELGHVLGLQHPAGGGQIMDPVLRSGGPTGYAPGDRAGFRLVGAAAGCIPATATSTVR